jgi:uncharacterized membrane protein
VLLGEDEGGLLLGVGSNDDGVVCLGIAVTVSAHVLCEVCSLAYAVSISPSSRMRTVCSMTLWMPVLGSLSTLYRRMLSLP